MTLDFAPAVPPSGLSASLSKRLTRYQALDAWRGMTCLLLVVYHSTMHIAPRRESAANWGDFLGYVLMVLTSYMNVGVPIFFVISGYCIMATLDARQQNGQGVGGYFQRRFRRIFPPYWAALLISAVTIWSLERFVWPGLFTRSAFKMNAPERLSLTEWLGNVTLTESWLSTAMGRDSHYLFGHAWTLCFEEQFYALAGFVLLVAPNRRYLAFSCFTALVPVLMILSRWKGIPFTGTIIGGEWFFFAAGIAAYYATQCAGAGGRRYVLMLLAAAVFVPMLDTRRLILPDSHARFNWLIAMLSAFLLAAFHQYDEHISSWRPVRALSRCGQMCYSLYLIHPLVTTGVGHALYRFGLRGNWETLLVTIPVSVSLSLASGVAFYYLVERHFLNTRSPRPLVFAI